MNIQIKEWKVKQTDFKLREEKESDKSDPKKNSFNLSFGKFFLDENEKAFGVAFQIDVKDEEFDLNVEMVFLFEADVNLPEDFANSPFININAPAIAFPFLRAFISNFTLQAGYAPVLLPSVNFVEFTNNRNEGQGKNSKD